MNFETRSPIGVLPTGWKLESLKNITTKIGSGSTPRGGEAAYLEERIEYAFIRSQNVFDFLFSESEVKYISDSDANKLKNVHLQKDDLLLNITGDGITFARCCIVPEEILPATVNQHVSIIRLDQEKCLPGYLLAYLCLPQIKDYISNFNAGGSRRAITKGHIETFDIPLPPMSIQRSIQRFTFDVMHKVRLNAQLSQNLEKIAQAIFKSWFVDFEPTKAKIAAREALLAENPAPTPEQIATAEQQAASQAIAGAGDIIPTEQLQTIADLFPSQLVDSELGEIPEGWESSSLGRYFDVVMGQSPKGDTYNEDGDGIVFYQGRRDFGFRFPLPRVYTTDPKRIAEKGDTLISVRAPVGDKNMADERCCLGRGLAAIRHKSGFKSFTYSFISHFESELANSGSEGTVFNSINQTQLKNFPFVNPTSDLIRSFEEVISLLDSRISINSKQIRTLTELRDSLLPKLLSGDIELGNTSA